MFNKELKDIKINNTYGDILIEGNDLLLVSGKEVIRSAAIERLKTNFNDFVFHPNEGANLDSFIGMGIDSTLSTIVSNRILDALTFDGLISRNSVLMLPVLNGNSIFIRIVISYNDEEIILNTNYSEGELEIDE